MDPSDTFATLTICSKDVKLPTPYLFSITYLKTLLPLAALNIIKHRVNYNDDNFDTNILLRVPYVTISVETKVEGDLSRLHVWLKDAMISVDKNYFESLNVVIHRRDTNEVIELYRFNINYLPKNKQNVHIDYSLNFKKAANVYRKINCLKEKVKYNVEDITLALDVLLNTRAPKGFSIPAFEHRNPSIKSSREDFEYFGEITTPYHKLSIMRKRFFYGSKSDKPSLKLKERNEECNKKTNLVWQDSSEIKSSSSDEAAIPKLKFLIENENQPCSKKTNPVRASTSKLSEIKPSSSGEAAIPKQKFFIDGEKKACNKETNPIKEGSSILSKINPSSSGEAAIHKLKFFNDGNNKEWNKKTNPVRKGPSKLSEIIPSSPGETVIHKLKFFNDDKNKVLNKTTNAVRKDTSKLSEIIPSNSDEAAIPKQKFFIDGVKKEYNKKTNPVPESTSKLSEIKPSSSGVGSIPKQNMRIDSEKKECHKVTSTTGEGPSRSSEIVNEISSGDELIIDCLCSTKYCFEDVPMIECVTCNNFHHAPCLGFKCVPAIPRPFSCYKCYTAKGKKYGDMQRNGCRLEIEYIILNEIRLFMYCVVYCGYPANYIINKIPRKNLKKLLKKMEVLGLLRFNKKKCIVNIHLLKAKAKNNFFRDVPVVEGPQKSQTNAKQEKIKTKNDVAVDVPAVKLSRKRQWCGQETHTNKRPKIDVTLPQMPENSKKCQEEESSTSKSINVVKAVKSPETKEQQKKQKIGGGILKSVEVTQEVNQQNRKKGKTLKSVHFQDLTKDS